ncbi:MAG TPA: cytochrome c [Ferrovibrio sp.]|jgi:cytochrome c556|uniref:c-type cytochrome n=1 Tax=Ferrovibrio sp. TaxID=1917215 RepID=UPI002B4B781A|nr:cytochrome c [Ferrovibrio sp.]HLT78827.1 cytochrome c [Ferrovibrio sp.]
MAMWHKALFAAVIGLSVASAGGFALAQADVIKARQEGMKAQGAAMTAIKKVVDGNGPAADAVAPARTIAQTSEKVPSLFPAGSDKGAETWAKPEIWANKADFDAKAMNAKAAAEKLAASAQAGNMDAVKADFAALGGTCGACHRPYRTPKN